MESKKIKIVLSAFGKFDLFRLAEGFDKRGLLFRMLTDFYSKKLPFLEWRRKDKENIDVKKVKLFIWPRLLRPVLSRFFKNYDYLENVAYDLWAKRQLEGGNLLISRTYCALGTLKKARSLGMKSILYRAGSHIVYQRDVLREEFALWKIPFEGGLMDKAIQRGLKEYKLCDFIFTPSSYTKKTFLEKGITGKKIITFSQSVNIGINKEDFLKDYEAKRNKTFKILYLGSVSINKGIPYLLQALEKIEKNNDIELVVVGGMQKHMKPFFDNLKGRFHYVGVVRNYEVKDYYREASVLVFPTIDDGFGQIMLEAMSFGVPVIATTNCAGPDIIEEGKNGFVVPVRNSEAIYEKIMSLYENRKTDQLREMGEFAIETAKKYSVDRPANEWAEFFNTLKI